MEPLMNNSGKSMKKRILKYSALFFLFMLRFTFNVMAEENAQETKEQLAHNEFMSYVYMVIGFIVVIAIAWYSTTRGQRNRERNDEPNATPHHPTKHKHDPYHGHGRHGTVS